MYNEIYLDHIYPPLLPSNFPQNPSHLSPNFMSSLILNF